MGTSKKEIKTFDEYFANFPKETQTILEDIRKLVKKLAPEAKELITYQMPTFELGKKQVIFCSFQKTHWFFMQSILKNQN